MIKAYYLTLALVLVAAFMPAVDAVFSNTPSTSHHVRDTAHLQQTNTVAVAGSPTEKAADTSSSNGQPDKPFRQRFVQHIRAGDDIKQIASDLFTSR